MKTSRRSAVDPFIVMDVARQAAQMEAEGRHVIHMEIGQPGNAAPAGARTALTQHLQDDPMGYTVSLGLTELRQRICDLYARWYDITLDPSRVIVTSGSSGAFLLGFTALFDTGARVGVAAPGYPSYRQILKALGMCPVDIPTRAENGHRMTPDDLPEELDGLIVASPGNPTGTILDAAHLQALMTHCDQHGISFISDEIYHGLHYDKRAISALELGNPYIINSFSKYFSMTGWRVGWMVVPEDHVRSIERLAQNMFICAPHVSQIAALSALDCIEETEANRAVYAANRDLLLKGLPQAGFTRFAPPDGAFYVYADVSELTDDSREFASEILQKTGVALTPGLDFDPARGHKTLRFSYAGTTSDIQEGLDRLQAFMAVRKQPVPMSLNPRVR